MQPQGPSLIRTLWIVLGAFWVLFSLALLFFFVPWLFATGRLCLTHWTGAPLFVAMLCLIGFPIVLVATNWWVRRKWAVFFDTKHNEILAALLVWFLLMVWMLAMAWLDQPPPIPGFEFFLGCA